MKQQLLYASLHRLRDAAIKRDQTWAALEAAQNNDALGMADKIGRARDEYRAASLELEVAIQEELKDDVRKIF